MTDDMHSALGERGDLLEQRAAALVDEAVRSTASWLTELGDAPSDLPYAQQWRHEARVVAAFRTDTKLRTDRPWGASPNSARAAILRAPPCVGRRALGNAGTDSRESSSAHPVIQR